MNRHVFIAFLLCALAAPRVADAGELQQQWQEKKDSWRAQWQEQQQGGGGQKAAAVIGELKEKYGHLSAQDAQELRQRAQQAKDKYLSAQERTQRWEAFKAEHPDLVADLKGTDEERRKQWEEWKEGHTAASVEWKEKTEAARKKWDELKELQSGDSAYEERANWRRFKFQNRDEAMDAKRKYDEWAKEHQGAAESLKAQALQWKASH